MRDGQPIRRGAGLRAAAAKPKAATPRGRSAEANSRLLGRIARSTRPRPHLRLDPPRCALLLVDPQRFFLVTAPEARRPAGRAAIRRMASLLGAWRACAGVVAVTQHGHRGARTSDMLQRFHGRVLLRDSPEAELVAGFEPRQGELLVRKDTYDAFHRTGLAQALRRRGMRQVLLAGVRTHLCVETTARSALVRGFEVYVVADATFTRTEALHEASLTAIADGFGRVLPCGEVLRACQAPSS